MTDAEGKQIILDIAAKAAADGKHTDAAILEVVAEYLTNGEFREKLRDYVWQRTTAA